MKKIFFFLFLPFVNFAQTSYEVAVGNFYYSSNFSSINVGDTVTFLPTEKGHMAASIKGMIPEGVESFKGKTNKTISYEITAEGLYGVRCTPHYANGMVAIIVVGSNHDAEAFLSGKKFPRKLKCVLKRC